MSVCTMPRLPFYVIDLFAGCGGLSEGFRQAGFQVVAQVEMDKCACQSLRTRQLYWTLRALRRHRLYHHYLREETSLGDIQKRLPELAETMDLSVIQGTLGSDHTDRIIQHIEASMRHAGANKFHVLLGGPPCQPYSMAGRGRDPARMQDDCRHYLYREYLKVLEHIRPDVFVYENVPGLFSARAGGDKIFLKILQDFSSLHPPYEITPPLERLYKEPAAYVLNSANFRVPQTRRRLFLIGFRKSLSAGCPSLITMFSALQKKAAQSRKKTPLTVHDAIADLPALKPGEGNDAWCGPYNTDVRLSPYQRDMRKGSPGILNHRARSHMSADLLRYRFFIQQQTDSAKLATLIDLMRDSPHLVPKHRHLDKFLDRFRVQTWDSPCTTVTAHIAKDGHYYIHPDIMQCRSFTVREAARCQSFPDNFKFEGPRTEQFKQVGNAVPPVLARCIAFEIMNHLRKVYG